MSDINLVIKMSEELYNHIKNDNVYYLEDGEELYAIVRNGVRHETVTEFADRCKECGREKVLNKLKTDIESHCGLAMENHCRYCSRCTNLMGIREILETIDKYGGGRNEFR